MLGNTEEFRCISLCSGYAGIELGLRMCIPNFRTVCYVEVEAFACANLAAKIEQGKLAPAPVWTDIKTFDGRPFRDRVHIVTAGYPCQGESVAGKRQGKADPRWLWPYIERTLKTVRPVWFFGENVSGHLTLGFPAVYRSLRNLGYSVEAGLFTAAECGAPHRRERLFILAHDTACRLENVQVQQEGKSTPGNGCRSLADTECPEQGKGNVEEAQAEGGRDRFAIDSPDVADTEQQRPKREGRPVKNRREVTSSKIGYLSSIWPARPGQPQYEWEEPRVVGNTGHFRKRKCGRTRKVDIKGLANNIRQTQSRLGGAAYGTASRVDRLRLLGNGVVPQCAELAFRTLMEKFSNVED